VSGNAASGAGFDMFIYPNAAAAQAAAAKLPKKSTAIVETSVIKFLGTISATGPAPPAPVNAKDLATLKTCIEQSPKRARLHCERPRRGEVPNRVRSGRKQP
jgi:hypothetical protein